MFRFYGVVDFKNPTPHASIPVFKKSNSNHLFVPRTNNHFIVVDFYELDELGFQTLYPVGADAKHRIEIGDTLYVPMVENSCFCLVDSAIVDRDLPSRYPMLSAAAISVFTSLRKRMLEFETETNQSSMQAEDFLNQPPVRSLYWISRLAATTKTIDSTAKKSHELLEKARLLRLEWLDRFARKATANQIDAVLEKPSLEMSDQEKGIFHAVRFSAVIEKKGMQTSVAELDFQSKKFPNGMIPLLRQGNFILDQQYGIDFIEVIAGVGETLATQFLDCLGGQTGNVLFGPRIQHVPIKQIQTLDRLVTAFFGFENVPSQLMSPVSIEHAAAIESIHRLAEESTTDSEGNITFLSLDTTLHRNSVFNIFTDQFVNDYENNPWPDQAYSGVYRYIQQFIEKALHLNHVISPNSRGLEYAYSFSSDMDFDFYHAICRSAERWEKQSQH